VRILVTGAAGFLGRFVVERLLEREHSVRAIVRPSSTAPRWDGDVEIFPADLRASSDLSPAFDGVDAVLHLAAAVTGNEDIQFASTVVGTERFLDGMARSSVKRLIHVSSIAVYDWSSVRYVMNEETPLAKNIYEMGGYTIAKVWQERLVTRAAHANGWDLTIMRPGFVWGPGHADIAGMGRQFGRIYLTFGSRTRLPLSHVLNCADCLVKAVETPLGGTHVFNVFDADEVRVSRYVSEYKRRSGKRGLVFPIPYHVGLGFAKLATITSWMAFGRKGKLPSLLMTRRFESQFKPVRFSNEKLRKDLGWTQRFNFEQCLDFTFADE
jgi:nucleoside-diphosphate-sugar epimerase